MGASNLPGRAGAGGLSDLALGSTSGANKCHGPPTTGEGTLS